MKNETTCSAYALTVLFAAATAATLNAASVGDTVVWRNSGTAGTSVSDASAYKNTHTLRFCLPSIDGLPNNSTVKITNISLGSRNTTLGDTDPIYVSIVKPDSSYFDSLPLNGTGDFSNDTISAHGTYVSRLSYSFANGGIEVVVGVTNSLETLKSDKYNYMTPGFKCVQTYDSCSALALVTTITDSGWYPVYEITATVVSLGSNPDTSATVAGDANLSELSWSTALTGDGTQWGKIEVTGNATLTLDATTNFKLLTINVAAGKTLTLTGANALTATKIDISGKGTVAAATSALSGAITGGGVVVYTGALPNGVTFDYNWCGTLSLANIDITGPNFNSYGNVASAIKLSGASGWVNTGTEYVVPIVLEDGNVGFALKLTNGNSPQSPDYNPDNVNRCSVFRKVSGNGSIVDGISGTAWPVIKIYDASEFVGDISLKKASIIVCDPSTTYDETLYAMFAGKTGVLRIDGDKRPTLASGKTWTINVYDDDDDHNGLVLFEKGDGVLNGGELNVSVNGTPLNTDRYAVKLRKGKVLIREIFGLRLRLF